MENSYQDAYQEMVSRYLLHLTIKYVSLEVGKMFILCMPSDDDCDQTTSSVDCYEPHTYAWSQVSGLWSVYTEGCMLLEDFLLLIVWKFMIQKIIYGLFFLQHKLDGGVTGAALIKEYHAKPNIYLES